jgi:type IV secretion system protein VirB8
MHSILENNKSWEVSENRRLRRSNRLGWTIAIIALCVIGALAAAITFMLPLKEVKPYLVRVDNNTGATDVVYALDQDTMTYDLAIDKYFLAKAVRCRNEYTNKTAFSNYDCFNYLAAANLTQAYYQELQPDNNPRSPFNTLGDGYKRISIRNVSPLDDGVAQVRFEQKESRRGLITTTYWIATITYEYINPSTDEQARLVNPLGFQVVDYKVAIENVQVSPTEASAPPSDNTTQTSAPFASAAGTVP